jgi:small subunit ribosomal protein S19e
MMPLFPIVSFMINTCNDLAAVARKVYLREGTGVGALKKRFGGSYRRGALHNIHRDASGGIIRYAIKTLDDLQITEKSGKGGRKMTRTGQQTLDQVARQVALGQA